jgi:UDP-3-O-[3-hydroxymyristoyl] N-acetylglucosamine deacetylase
MYLQRTLQKGETVDGTGLHSGRPVRMSLVPSGPDTGIVFVRRDLGGMEIPALIGNSGKARHATVLQKGEATVSTVEHLMSALYALGVDNLRVEIDGAEVPILDGSASPFVEMIRRCGLRNLDAPRQYMVISRPLEIVDDEKRIAVYPCEEYRVTYAIDFEHPRLGYQDLTVSPWGVEAYSRCWPPPGRSCSSGKSRG